MAGEPISTLDCPEVETARRSAPGGRKPRYTSGTRPTVAQRYRRRDLPTDRSTLVECWTSSALHFRKCSPLYPIPGAAIARSQGSRCEALCAPWSAWCLSLGSPVVHLALKSRLAALQRPSFGVPAVAADMPPASWPRRAGRLGIGGQVSQRLPPGLVSLQALSQGQLRLLAWGDRRHRRLPDIRRALLQGKAHRVRPWTRSYR